MIGRRSFLTASVMFAWSATRRKSLAAATLDDSGLYHEPWFLESFLELKDDAAAAVAKNKRFAIIWELRGCPYCRDTHLINFAKADIEIYVKEHFDILQLNLVGARDVIDFDGERLSEKKLAQKYGVLFTPTLQFFDDRVEELGQRAPRDREVARSQGYLHPPDFLGLFRYVAERAYQNGTLRDYLRAKGT